MLVKNTKTEGTIVSLKLSTGEEIIGKIIEDNLTDILLSKPLSLGMGPEGPGLIPVMMSVNVNEQDLRISKSFIVTSAPTRKEVADQYTTVTSGIQPASTVPDFPGLKK